MSLKDGEEARRVTEVNLHIARVTHDPSEPSHSKGDRIHRRLSLALQEIIKFPNWMLPKLFTNPLKGPFFIIFKHIHALQEPHLFEIKERQFFYVNSEIFPSQIGRGNQE